MAQQLKPGETVFVPWSVANPDKSGSTALASAKVAEIHGNSVVLSLPDGTMSRKVGASRVHRSAAILILRVGDFKSEVPLLDPLAKSLLQYLRLLLPDDSVRLLELRSLAELAVAWPLHAPAFSHIVLIGHGSADALTFGVDGPIKAADLATKFIVQPEKTWSFLSLCCETGYAGFAKAFSETSVCREITAPFHDVHGAIASQFAQSYFAYHFLEGETSAIAFRHARQSTPGAVSFRLWRDGSMTSDAA